MKPPSPSLLLLLLALPLAAVACGDDAAPGPATPGAPRPVTAADLPPVRPDPASAKLSGEVQPEAVGTRCAPCHEDLVAAYRAEPMHASLSLPSGEGSVEATVVGRGARDPESGATAMFGARGGHYVQRAVYIDPAGNEEVSFEASVDLVVGAGRRSRSYLHVREGRVYELPLSFDRELGDVVAAPWIAQRSMQGAGNLCIACHAGTVTPVRPDAAMGITGALSLGISCERCHGPSDEHVATKAVADTVQPRRLTPERQEELCLQCHMPPALIIESPRRSLASYVPGERLGDRIGAFVEAPPATPAEISVTSLRGDRLRLSRCFTETDEATRPTCFTCHEVHPSGDAPGVRRADRGCLGCHAADACRETPEKRQEAACATCHMRTVPAGALLTGALQHTAYTDHWIRRAPPDYDHLAPVLRGPDLAAAGAEIVDLLDPNAEGEDAALHRALAFAQGTETRRALDGQVSDAWRKRAEEAATAHLRAHPGDGWALAVRGRMLVIGAGYEAARKVLEQARKALPGAPGPIGAAGYAAAECDDFADADTLFAEALQIDPFDDDLAAARARVLVQLVRRPEALRILDALRLMIGPSERRAFQASEVAWNANDVPGALRHTSDLLLFAPGAADVHTRVGELLAMVGEAARARLHLAEALRINPDFEPARRILQKMETR